MENTIFIVLFVGGILLFLGSMGVDVVKVALKFTFRCLSGIVFICVANFFIQNVDKNFVVNINEITVGVSGVLGIWGVFVLYGLQCYFTMT